MHKIIQLFVVLLLIAQLAVTQERQIKLLNPDGTPATDAKVVGVLLAPGGVVDQDLKPRHVAKVDKQPLSDLVNENGTVTVTGNDTKAIVASNERGFLFLPTSAFGDKAKLREWAHVELDVSTVPDDMRADITLNIMWTNSLQGFHVRPNLNQNNDPFRDEFDRPEEIEPKSDWRFDPMIAWTQSVPVTNQSVRVPPGEITISLASKQPNDLTQLPCELPPGSVSATVGLWQVTSGSTQHIELPEFGVVEGTIRRDSPSTLPDWSQSGSEAACIRLNHSSFQTLPPILRLSGSIDEYFAKLTSGQGFKSRQDAAFGAKTTASDGKFRFPLVPVSTYSIHKLIEAPGLPRGNLGQPSYAVVPLKPYGEVVNPSIVVNAKNTTVVDFTEVPLPAQAIEALSRIPASASPANLPPGWAIGYEEHIRIVDGKELRVTVPRLVQNQKQTTNPVFFGPDEFDEFNAPPDNSAPRYAPGIVAPFEPDVPPTPDPKPDAATLLIQNWLQSAKDPSDQTELRKLLLDHLQQEFDANQKSRQAEIERLQQLLVKSKEWLDQRQQRRDEIIKKRLDELMQQESLKTEASGGR